MGKCISSTLMLTFALVVSACGGAESPISDGVTTKSAPGTRAPTAASPQESEDAAGSRACGDNCKFGQVAEFTARAGSGPDRPIEISVAAPVTFDPSDRSGVEGATQAENVYFLITLTNLSDTEPWSPTILSSAASGGVDASQIYTDGRCCGGPDSGKLWPDKVPPGKTVTVRDEWSLKDVGNVRLTLDIDGLAGDSINFRN